jgi:hypothetical protein
MVIPILFLGFFVISSHLSDLHCGTLKKHFIDGMTKEEIYITKFGNIFVLAIANTIFTFIIFLIFGMIFKNMAIDTFFSLDYLKAYTSLFYFTIYLLLLFLFMIIVLESNLVFLVLFCLFLAEKTILFYTQDQTIVFYLHKLPITSITDWISGQSWGVFITTFLYTNLYVFLGWKWILKRK